MCAYVLCACVHAAHKKRTKVLLFFEICKLFFHFAMLIVQIAAFCAFFLHGVAWQPGKERRQGEAKKYRKDLFPAAFPR